MTLIFASSNAHKLHEMQSALGNVVELVSLRDAGIHVDIPEPHETLDENASEKSGVTHQLTGKNCFSEDTGLEVEALDGAPGVRSARYAGEPKSGDENIKKLLNNLQSKANRNARFRTVISLRIDSQEYLFEGICEGRIIHQQKGSGGFGYDSVFVPNGASKTFGEMNLEEKNKYSHRRKAADQLILFLQHLNSHQFKPNAENQDRCSQ